MHFALAISVVLGLFATMAALTPTLQFPISLELDDALLGDVVIIGGGIVGLSTAYYLALASQHPEGASSRRVITIVESSSRLCPGASSQAQGGLGDFGFPSSTVPLGVLSYELHRSMASEFHGAEKYGFSDATIFRVLPKNFSGAPQPPDEWGPAPPQQVPLASLPGWLRPSEDWTAEMIAGPPHSAHLDCARFCSFLQERCEELGVRFVLDSTVTSVAVNEAAQSFVGATVQTRDGPRHELPCRAIVIAAGPWSARVFATLFPEAKISIPMNETAAAGNHFRVKGRCPEPGSEHVFLGNVVPGRRGLDISSSLDGTLWVGGYGAIPEELPELADHVKMQPALIEAMAELTRHYIGLSPDEKLDMTDVSRCYLPHTTLGHPIITKVDWHLLSKVSKDKTHAPGKKPVGHGIVGGLYLNTGHGGNGITLSLGSGKVMSELLLGRTPSADISGLGLAGAGA